MKIDPKTLYLINLFAPVLVRALVPHGDVIAPLVAEAITDAEMLHGAGTGAAKRAYVLESVKTAVSLLNAAKGKTVIDPALIAGHVGSAIDLTIGIVNDVHKIHDGLAKPPDPAGVAGSAPSV